MAMARHPWWDAAFQEIDGGARMGIIQTVLTPPSEVVHEEDLP